MNGLENLCQSCGMPLTGAKSQGTNADGSLNTEYCKYCFEDGKFTHKLSMEEMIDICVPFTSKGNPWPDAETARTAMNGLFPMLKRWHQESSGLCICGAECAGCPHLGKECQGGCVKSKGKVYWARYLGVEICPLYKCADEKHLLNCGYCEKLPCDMWFSLKDPTMTDEQQQQSIKDRVKKLKASVK